MPKLPLLTVAASAFALGVPALVAPVPAAAQNGRISEIIDVPLPYPRNDDLRLSPAFAEIRAHVWRGVHHRDGAHPPPPPAPA